MGLKEEKAEALERIKRDPGYDAEALAIADEILVLKEAIIEAKISEQELREAGHHMYDDDDLAALADAIMRLSHWSARKIAERHEGVKVELVAPGIPKIQEWAMRLLAREAIERGAT